jgi:hypothetical protein
LRIETLLRPLHRCKLADQFPGPEPSLPFAPDADGRFAGFEAQDDRETIEAAVPFHELQALRIRLALQFIGISLLKIQP